jgi:flagellar basal-body rod protein FlgG
MLPAIRASVAGLLANKQFMEVISNNLANLNTPGFKVSRPDFRDLLYQNLTQLDGLPPETVAARVILPQLGIGTGIGGLSIDFRDGIPEPTGRPLDLAIQGPGFLQVRLPNGQVGYTRNGILHVDTDGRLVDNRGNVIEPQVGIPANFDDLTIDPDGTVRVREQGSADFRAIGRLQLAKFTNPNGLLHAGYGIFLETESSGAPQLGNPEDPGFGRMLSRMLERANVDLAQAMADLIFAQRAYQLNARALQTADQMVAMANQLRR